MTSSDVDFEDRFSALPDSLVLRILSLVPIRQVITATSTLSKRFQHLWTHVPNLIFHQVTNQNHIHFVTQTLSLRPRTSKIHHLFLDVEIKGDLSFVNQWLDLAAVFNADALDLSLSADVTDHMLSLPQKLYTCPSLRKLKISYFSVDNPFGVIVSLNSLVMLDCECSGEAMRRILAGCPVLEYLEMCFIDFEPTGRLILDSKSVRKLDFYGTGDQDAVPVVLCMPSLVDADLSFNLNYFDDDQVQCVEIRKRFQQLLASLGSVVNLKLTVLPSCSVFSAEALQAFPSQQLVNCKSMSLQAHVIKSEFPGMANLLQLVPNVEVLYLDFDYVQWNCKSCIFDGNDVELRERFSKCSLDRLKFVRIHISEAQFYAFDVELVYFLLKKATVLEKMLIYPRIKSTYPGFSRWGTARGLLRTTTRLLSFPRSSPNAVVRFMFKESDIFA